MTEKEREYHRNWYWAHVEKRRKALQEAYKNKPEIRERRLIRSSIWTKNNPEKVKIM